MFHKNRQDNINDRKTDISADDINDNVKNIKSALYNFCRDAYAKSCEGPFGGIIKRVDRKFIKFLFVGLLNTAFGYSVYAVLVTILSSQSAALFLQYILGVFWNFKTTGSLVFKNKNNSLIFKFFGVYVFTFFVNLAGLKWLSAGGFGKYVSQAIMVFPVAVLSFIMFKYLVFKKECA